MVLADIRANPHDRTAGDNAGLWLALLICAAVVAARWAALAVSPIALQGDEAQYWSWSRDLAWGYFSKPPVIAWVIFGAERICGDGPACIRGASALIHGGTSLLLFVLARRLFGGRAGLWACVIFLTLPGISFSSALISTDVPLLFFWAAALVALERVMATGSTAWAVLLGLALGMGFLSKYAMAFFLGCFLLYALFTPGRRRLLLAGPVLLAVALGLMMLLPNIWWNLENGWITFSHTAANANLKGPSLRPDKGLEFLGAQFGVFGPILLLALLATGWRVLRGRLAEPWRFLVFFSLPVLLLITLEAFLSRAHANWAATSYVAGTVLVAGLLGQARWHRWRTISLALHGIAALAILLLLVKPEILGPQRALGRLAGWDALAARISQEMEQRSIDVLIADERMEIASLLYQFRDRPVPLYAWDRNGRIDNHYELTRPYEPGHGTLLLLTRHPGKKALRQAFCDHEPLGEVLRPDGFGGGKAYQLLVVRDVCS